MTAEEAAQLVRFIQARLNVDDANAHRLHDIGLCPKSQATYYDRKVACTCEEEDRARRDVAAKRAVLAESQATFEWSQDPRCPAGQRETYLRVASGLMEAVKRLAAVWDNHPDFRKEWAVD